MKSSPKIEKAMELATTLHAGQFRKNGTTPYINHLLAVAEILSQYTNDEDVIIAGLMHDTIEDVPGYTYDKLTSDCGKNVADIVMGVTEEKFRGHKELPREERIKLFEEMILRNVANTERAGKGSILVALADKIHNLNSMIEGFKEEGENYFSKFNNPIEQKLWFYRKVLEMSKRNISSPILERFEKVLLEAEDSFKNIPNRFQAP
jgi:(p)ppGpp synthase/HD superfamily hydrolase